MKYWLLILLFVVHPLSAQIRVGGGDNSDYDKPKNPIYNKKKDHPKISKSESSNLLLEKVSSFSKGLHRAAMKCHRNGDEIMGRSVDFLNIYNKIAMFRDLSVINGSCNNEAKRFFQCLITPDYKNTVKELLQFKELPHLLKTQYLLTSSEASQVIHFFHHLEEQCSEKDTQCEAKDF